LQESVDLGSGRLGVFSEKKLLVVFYLNGVLYDILFPGKYTPARGYMCIEVGSFKRYVLPRNELKEFWSLLAMVVHVMIWTCMRRENAEIIVKTILEGCPPPRLILGQEDCSRLQSSRTKEVLHAGNHDAFFKDLPRTLFHGHYSQLWKDFRPNKTNTILIDDTAEKGALCEMATWWCYPHGVIFFRRKRTLVTVFYLGCRILPPPMNRLPNL
jgi:hypothetical protein